MSLKLITGCVNIAPDVNELTKIMRTGYQFSVFPALIYVALQYYQISLTKFVC